MDDFVRLLCKLTSKNAVILITMTLVELLIISNFYIYGLGMVLMYFIFHFRMVLGKRRVEEMCLGVDTYTSLAKLRDSKHPLLVHHPYPTLIMF